MHLLCLQQDYVLGNVMLPNMGSLKVQYVFVMVKFLCVRFPIFS